jgi:hypothetical protein
MNFQILSSSDSQSEFQKRPFRVSSVVIPRAFIFMKHLHESFVCVKSALSESADPPNAHTETEAERVRYNKLCVIEYEEKALLPFRKLYKKKKILLPALIIITWSFAHTRAFVFPSGGWKNRAFPSAPLIRRPQLFAKWL